MDWLISGGGFYAILNPVLKVLLFLFCFAAYFNSFQNQFLFDDHVVLFGQKGVAGKSFEQFFLHNQGGDFFRPVGHVLLWLSSLVFGSHVTGYHAFNFLLFYLIVLGFYIITLEITADRPLAFLTAILYAVHPINGFLVNYVTASVIATCTLLMQASFGSFLVFCRRRQQRDYVLSLSFLVLAALSHEMVIMLPVILLAYIYFVQRERFKELAGFLAPMALFLAVWFVWRSQENFFHVRVNNLQGMSHAGPVSVFSTWMGLVGWYLSKLFYPREIIFLWSRAFGTANFLPAVIQIVAVLVLLALAVRRWRPAWKPFMACVFAAGFIPTLWACFIYSRFEQPFIEPHWFYFSEFGFFVLAAWALLALMKKSPLAGRIAAACVIGFLLVWGWQNNTEWRSQESYSRYWLSLNGGNLTPYYWLGRTYLERGDCRHASQVFERGYGFVHTISYNLAADWGHCMDVLGRDQQAYDLLYTAKMLDPQYALTRYYIGLHFLKQGRHDLARQAFQNALTLDPKMPHLPGMDKVLESH